MLMSITRRQSADFELDGGDPLCRAGVVDEHVEPAEDRGGLADDADDGPFVGDVEGPGPRASAGFGDLSGDRHRRRGVDVGDRHGRARLGEGKRRGAANPGAGAGDERRIAVKAEEIEDAWNEGHDSPEARIELGHRMWWARDEV